MRRRAGEVLAAGEAGVLAHFRVREERLDDAARFVAGVIRERYPDLDVPFHSRWRHFDAGGVDRWAALAARLDGVDAPERARIRIDLAVTSVLLDAGAGATWRYVEAQTGQHFARSEGLAVASLRAFESGAFSSAPGAVPRADAAGLARCTEAALARAFQVDAGNPLVGIAGRAALLHALSRALRAYPALFGADPARPGHLYDHLAARARAGAVSAREVLAAILEGFSGIWPGRIEIGGANLGDVWRHRAVRRDDETDGLVPFHKLSQWLAYSLVEPLEEAGLAVRDLDALTGLAEYRNGGLLVDLGVLEPTHPEVLGAVHDVGSEPIVEWRALTVALLDRLAPRVRDALGPDARPLSLARLLEGGTWAAGRRAAAERRADAAPPLAVASDGTVF